MSVNIVEFAIKIYEAHTKFPCYEFYMDPLVYSEDLKAGGVKIIKNRGEENKDASKAKEKEKLERSLRKIEESILEQRQLLNLQSGKISIIRAEMKKQAEEFRKMKDGQDSSMKKLKSRLEPASILSTVKGSLYIEQMRSGRI